MPEKIELTTEEKVLLQKHLDKFQKSGRNWKYQRFFVLGCVCLLFFFGIKSTLIMESKIQKDFDAQAFIEHFGCDEIPENEPFKYWIVGYVNKVAVISELHRQSEEIYLFEACLGLVEIAVAIFGSVFVVNRWNDGKRNLVIAKVIANYLE